MRTLREAVEAVLLDYEPCDGGMSIKDATDTLEATVEVLDSIINNRGYVSEETMDKLLLLTGGLLL